MKKRIITSAIIGATLIAVLSLSSIFRADSSRDWFEETTGLNLPSRATNVVHFTEFEFAFTSHYSIPVENLDGFIEAAGLTREKPENWKPLFDPERLPAPWNEIPESDSIYYGTGANTFAAWDLLLDKNTQSLWTSIYYADYSGDLPDRVIQH